MPSPEASPMHSARAAALGQFLRSRRARLSPAEVGLPGIGRRRAAGLRREEVAQLAGISPAWYTHLEQGRDVRPSRDVLDALAGALRLSVAEQAHLLRLVDRHWRRPARGTVPGSPRSQARACPAPTRSADPLPSLGRLLDALEPTPALVIDCCWDLVGRTAALAAVLPDLGTPGAGGSGPPVNMVEYVLGSDACRAAVSDWALLARMAVDGLRASLPSVAADDPAGARAAALVERLTAASPEFRAWWPEYGLWVADRPVTHVLVHPRVGRLEFDGTMLDIRSAPGLTLVTYVPCDAVSADRLRRIVAPGS
jgi:transcriptional regulator with XRE-family HTH domain